jgi:enterochelin esterase family protein
VTPETRAALELKGYPVTYSEFDGGHTYSARRGSLAGGLIALLGEPTVRADGSADRS